MVTYPDLSNLNNASGIGGLMSIPNSSYPYFWAWILGGIWVIMTLTMYLKEKEKTGKERILSSMSVACLGIILLAIPGTFFTIISVNIMVNILVLSAIVWAIWFFSGK